MYTNTSQCFKFRQSGEMIFSGRARGKEESTCKEENARIASTRAAGAISRGQRRLREEMDCVLEVELLAKDPIEDKNLVAVLGWERR